MMKNIFIYLALSISVLNFISNIILEIKEKGKKEKENSNIALNKKNDIKEDSDILNTQTRFDNVLPLRDNTWRNLDLPIWSQIKYAGDENFPNQNNKLFRSWPMFEFDINEKNEIVEKGTNNVIDCKLFYHRY